MKTKIFNILAFFSLAAFSQQSDSLAIRKIYDEILMNGKCYQNLDYLCNKIGNRISGSPQAAAAVEWAKQAMIDAGADTVFLQEVMVPHWVRGEKEVGMIVNSKNIGSKDVAVKALGGSVGTGVDGITANVIEVKTFEELTKLGAQVKGKIVFFNRAFDAKLISTGSMYGGAVNQRGSGPSEAAKYGAVGVVVRSMTLANDDFPHTGALHYKEGVAQIPACAISTKGANLLSQLLKNDSDLKFFMRTTCQTLPDVKSYNVVGEIKGSEKADEIIVVGGHLDSWDVGQGAHDDGAGIVQSIEVIRALKASGIKPKRTIRAVAFMNEENGLKGGLKYAELAKQNKEKHIAAMESDGGGFTPRGFGAGGDKAKVEKIRSWQPLLESYLIYKISAGGEGGADIGPLEDQGTILIGYECDNQRYFDYHHTDNDTFDKVNKRELELGAAAMTSLIYLISYYGL